MKKVLCILLALAMIVSAMPALALNYSGNLGNEASFETMAEVKANAPAAMEAILGSKYMIHPAMDSYPGESTYVYRSADMYGRNAASRLNTNLVVYSDKQFASKDEAKAYLADLGLIDIIDQATGSVILVTPADPAAGFGAADQKNYYKLQTAMFTLSGGETVGDVSYSYVDGVYYGGFGFYYVIGIDGGATFLNNYIVGTLDYVSRIAGMLLVNGKMARISTVAAEVPVYLVNADDDIIDKYAEANSVDACFAADGVMKLYNKQFPARQVMYTDIEDVDLKAVINSAYYDLMIKGVRGQERKSGLNSASTPYQGYTSDCAPYSLHVRNAVIDGRTVDGINLITTVSDELKDICTSAGEYLETWYEYIPDEVLNGTAPEGSVPMFLLTHGGGDDPRQYVDGQGYLELAGKERLVIVAPDFADMGVFGAEGKEVTMKAFPALVRLMEEKYPAIDRSRVYVNGYSMGSLAAHEAAFGDPSVFAAAFPQAGIMTVAPTAEQKAHFADVDLPFALSTSEYDIEGWNINPVTRNPVDDFYNLISDYLEMNGMDRLPETPDWESYPMRGFAGDTYSYEVLNDEYGVHTWCFLKDGIPMVRFSFITDIVHCLYPEYANMVWDFVKHYSRDQATGQIVYDPYVR